MILELPPGHNGLVNLQSSINLDFMDPIDLRGSNVTSTYHTYIFII